MSKKKRRKPKCALCREPIELRPDNEHFPFCSERCRMQDLGKWLDEDYRIPMTQSGTERKLPPEDLH
jgi:endogenous inhibitor of DNA gyrase (YacG/DUF329 family)